MKTDDIKIDREACIGCGSCALVAPDTFEMDDENKAKLTGNTGDTEANIKLATESCPVEAIKNEQE